MTKKQKKVEFRETLVLKPSDKPKLRTALMNTINSAEEAKALIREMFLRDLIKATQAYCESNGIPVPKDRFGMYSVKKIPKDVLARLSAEEMKQYVAMLKDLASTQCSAMKILDPFDSSKSAAAIKQQATKPAKSFQDLLAETIRGKASGDD